LASINIMSTTERKLKEKKKRKVDFKAAEEET
jgi:hypothetical protein